MAGDHLLVYDGVCGLCNGLVPFVLARDRRSAFDFAWLQSDAGRSIVRTTGRDPDRLSTLVVVADYRTPGAREIVKARAVLFILRTIGGPWRAAAALLGVFSTALLDWKYDLMSIGRTKELRSTEFPLLDLAVRRGLSGHRNGDD